MGDDERQMNIVPRTLALVLASSIIFVGCSREGVPREQDVGRADGDSVSFVNKVWQVASSSDGASALGSIYVFLSEGTLLITSTHSTPMLGTWKQEAGALTMVEEGIPYKVDILHLSSDEFRIRSNHPGGFVEITLVPAEAGSAPK